MISKIILSGILLSISSYGDKFIATIFRDNGSEIDALSEVPERSQGGAIYGSMNKFREISFLEARK